MLRVGLSRVFWSGVDFWIGADAYGFLFCSVRIDYVRDAELPRPRSGHGRRADQGL